MGFDGIESEEGRRRGVEGNSCRECAAASEVIVYTFTMP